MLHKEITLLTLTCDRPVAFELCKKWGSRAIAKLHAETDYHVRWMVVDSGTTKVQPLDFQEHYPRLGEENLTLNFLANLKHGLARIKESEAVIFLEDDDYYAEEFLLTMVKGLMLNSSIEIVGEKRARYYNIEHGAFHENTNELHASLCSTAVQGKGLEVLKSLVLCAKNAFVDLELWNSGKLSHKLILPHSGPNGRSLVVGMKGLPGRRGIGCGHQEKYFGKRRDAKGTVLRKWIGKEDAAVYFDLGMRAFGSAD